AVGVDDLAGQSDRARRALRPPVADAEAADLDGHVACLRRDAASERLAAPALLAAAGPAPAAPACAARRLLALDRGFRVGELARPDIALLRELGLIRAEERREPDEPDPDQRREADDLREEDDEEAEHEERLDDQEAERDQAGPPQPFPHVEVWRVAAERPRPDVVEDREDDQQPGRGEPRRVEQVGEVVAVERSEQVFPGRFCHGRASGSTVDDGAPEYAMAGRYTRPDWCGA